MSHFVRSIIVPAGLLVVVAVAVWRRKMSWREDIALRAPGVGSAAFWILLWAGWVALSEIVGPHLGIASPWGAFRSLEPQQIVLRGIGIVLLAPVGEELAFRGLFYRLLERSRLGVAGAILIPGAAFALLHVQYGAVEMGIIGIDALLLGMARWRSGSILVPIAMHVLGNTFAFVQRMV